MAAALNGTETSHISIPINSCHFDEMNDENEMKRNRMGTMEKGKRVDCGKKEKGAIGNKKKSAQTIDV